MSRNPIHEPVISRIDDLLDGEMNALPRLLDLGEPSSEFVPPPKDPGALGPEDRVLPLDVGRAESD